MSDAIRVSEDEASSLVGVLEGIDVALPKVSSSWSRAAQHLLKPLSLLSLRRTSSAPPFPSIYLLQPIFNHECGDEPTTNDIKLALVALLSLKAYEEQALKFLADGQGPPSGEKLITALLAKGLLWCFGSIFTLLQRSPPGLIDDAVLPDLLRVPGRALRGFFIHWQTALRVTADADSDAIKAEATLEEVRQNLTGFGVQLFHDLDGAGISVSVTAIVNDCKITPLISTSLAFTAAQQHQIPRVIAPIPKTTPAALDPVTMNRVISSLGVLSSQDLYNLLHTLCNSLETVPAMYDARKSGEMDDPVAVVEDLTLANERPLRLSLDLCIVKTDLALSVAVEQVRNAPHAPSKSTAAGGKRGRGSLSSSRARSMSRKAGSVDSPDRNAQETDPTEDIETPENIEVRVKREEHEAIIGQWEAQAEESLISTMTMVRELLVRGKKSVITRPSLLHHFVADDGTGESDVGSDSGAALDDLQEGSSPSSDFSSSESVGSQTSSVYQATICKPLEALNRLAGRFFEWRIGRWESLRLKESVRRDAYTRGRDGILGTAWDLLGVSLMTRFEQDDLIRAGLEQDQLEAWLDAITEHDRPRTGKRRKSDQHEISK